MRKNILLRVALFMYYCILPAAFIYSQETRNSSFVHINSEHGLSQSNVKAILQDSYGFMWFGTKNGLNRYDGKSVTRFNCNDYILPRSNHNISALFEDKNHNLWIGTDEGVYIYNPLTELFRYLNVKAQDGTMMTDWISSIKKDTRGNIWIVVPGQGIFRYSNNKLYHYELEHPQKSDSPSDICICSDGQIWVCAWNMGLFKYIAHKDKFEQVKKDAKGRSLLNIETNTISQWGNDLIMAVQSGELKRYNYKKNILSDIEFPQLKHTFVRNATVFGNEIWVGTYDGLYVIDQITGEYRQFKQSPLFPSGLSDNVIYTIYQDREGGIWAGTMFGGVNYLPQRKLNFIKYLPEHHANSLSSKLIREMAEDNSGNIWIGTEDAGLNVLNLETKQVRQFKATQKERNTNVTLAVWSDNNKILCGLYKSGLEAIDSKGKSTFLDCSDLNIEGNSIYALYKDRKQNKWIGTDWGVFFAPNDSKTFQKIPELENNWVFDILESTNGTIWFATMGKGVWKYEPKTKKYTHYTNKEGDASSLSSNSVSSITEDHKGNIWFSTDRGGICKYNASTNDFTRVSIEEGLPDDVAYKILEDSYGRLWFGTNRGLVRFQPETNEIRVFTVKDGLCGNQFNYKSAVKASDGNFYFGTVEGLVCFNPENEDTIAQIPPLYITRLSIFNKEVTVQTPDSPLKKSIIETEEITLPYDRANISLDMALLSYATSQSNEYFYKLEPIDKDWISNGSNNSIAYANLSPGKYILHLRATTGDSKKQMSVRSLEIIVLPPWWYSSWAIAGYIVIIICIATIWFLWYRHRKNEQLAEKQKLFEIEKEKELFENKVGFFTEIAHEIRTPLTLINGPLEMIQEMNIKDEKLQRNLQVIDQNTKRLLNLATQLLDFQKVGANKLTLNYETVNISNLLQETISRFEPTYNHNGKEIELKDFDEEIIAKVDKEAITKILSNLFNNALKYSEHHTEITLRRDEDDFLITISNDGQKIPHSTAEQIFEPFFQLNGQTKKEKHGVGIGLALARSLAHLHKGSLKLDTLQNNTTFILTIPLNIEKEVDITEISDQADLPLTENVLSEENAKGNVILVVEDDENILNFMKERLSDFFIVETATDGQKALDILHKSHIDLIISDIMMPVMNGIEFCHAIKSDINLCHIPVIFLTAKNDINSKIQGLKAGAEAYIEKPFSFDYLKTQIESLLSNRQKERETFSKRPFFPVKNMQMSKEDEEFMERVLKVINDNLKDENFNVERMAEELCLSRSSLLRKIKTLFNLSPIDFIRLIRLKRAAELIQEGKYRVGEICYMVGFNSHSYFSKLFCKQFGMTPKDFEKQVQAMRDKSRSQKDIKIEDLIQGNNTLK